MPGSASRNTRGWNAATPAAPPTRSWTPSPAPCSSTTPNAPTCSTWSAQPTPPRRRHRPRAARPGSRCAGAPEHAGGDERRPGLHPQRPPGHPGGQRPGPGPVRADLHSPARPVNAARFTFLDPAATEFYPDWDAVADQNVATLRAEVGLNPYDKALSDLIGELSTRGDTFRQRWAQHEVRRHRAGAKRLNHPLVGQLTFTYETMELGADEGLFLVACGVAPGSRDADALNLLASWHATLIS